MKKIKRALSLVLVFCMLCTMTVTGFAADTTSEGQTDFMKIVHLDAGRKYFSVDSIKKIIDNASADGYNYLELAVGNDGLRFLLDDMSVTVNDKTYDSSVVSQAIHAGNEAYYNFDTDELTQSEMDTIIAYANKNGISIIPLINSPGHMDAILSAANSLAGTNCSYNGSARTIDVTNATAVAFTQALIQKYVTYFADKGCKYFNMGADEYANDIYTKGSMGFGNLQTNKKYSYFVTYVNQMAAMITNAGMTPMAFNDGIYFNNDTSSGEFDTDIVISYWSKGWDGYTPMSASKLASMGFKLINTHGDYYWVLGKSDWQCSAEKASGFNYKEFQGGTIENPAGAMFCIWCDYPGADTEANVVSNTADTMAAFAKTLPSASNSSDSSDSGITTPNKAPAASEVPSDALTSNSIKLEYWITNRQVTADNAISKTIRTSTDGITTEAGVDISSLAPSNGYNDNIKKTVYYWQTMRLDSDHEQTDGNKVDQTASGTTLTHIRYLNGAWQYQTSDGTWNYFQSDDQLVAYYLQKTDVTKEITTYAKDWGYEPGSGDGNAQVALTVAVVYPDGTVSPTESEMYSSSTTMFNYWNKRDIGIVAPTNNSDYNISKITVTNGERSGGSSATWSTGDSIKWEKTTNDADSQRYNETTVWDKTTNAGTTPMVNGAAGTSTKEGIIWSAKNTAKLVLIYLEPVEKETNLNVVYWDDTSNAQINKNNIQIVMSGENATYTNSLKNSSGQVIGTKTDWNSNDKSSSDYLPDDAYVTNSTGINQTINKDISLLTNVDTKYQTGLYAYQKAVISGDGKTLTLHYSFDDSKLTAQYVVDFGESVNVPIADIIDTSKVTSSIDKMEFAVVNGEAKVSSGTDNSITFTPTSIMQTPVIVTVKITFKDDNKSTISPKIAFVPASNVMYEESFVKRGEDEENSSWKTTGKADTENQAKEVLGQEGIHGYDESYDTDSTFSNGSAYQATLTLENGKEFVKTKDKATFTFTGTGFDLISECGTDTGIVSVVVKDASGSTVKAYLVDTYFTGDTDKIISGTGVLDYQVPIVRCTELEQGTYTVETRGYLTSGSGAVAKTAEETTEDEEVSEETVAEVLDDLNVKNVDASEVEATCMDDNSVLLGGTGAEETTTSAKSKARAAAKTTNTTASVYIDGVRVYNTLNNSNGAQSYTASEQNVKYESVYDYVKNSLDVNEDVSENPAVYVEYDGDQEIWGIADYKQQGPENEVYLTAGHSIAIALDGYKKGDTVQIAAKAINGEVSCDGLETTALSTATEMYYTADVITDDDGSAYVQVTNNAGSKGVLALSEMKVSNNISAIADPTLVTKVLEKLNHKADFVPETLTVSAPETLAQNRLSTLSVKASASDVEDVYLSIDDGKAERLQANNNKAVKRGKSKTYSYSVAINPDYDLKVGKHTYSVYAVSKDGKYSDPVVATVTVTAAK